MSNPVFPGIDSYVRDDFRAISGARVALFANQCAVGTDGTHLTEHLLARDTITLTRVLAAEHGAAGTLPAGAIVPDTSLTPANRTRTDIPVFSLYPPSADSTAPESSLRDVDLLLIDMPDVGTRYYTYLYSALCLLRRAAIARVPVIVLDRPNPIGGIRIEGPILEHSLRSPVGAAPVPIRHGLTLGELLRLMNDGMTSPPERPWPSEPIAAALTVVPVSGWDRISYLASPWIPPSPGLPSRESAFFYPGTCLFEAFDCSLGRGTALPFQQIGHPQIDAARWLRELERSSFAPDRLLFRGAHLPGADIRVTSFTPTTGKHSGTLCHGLKLALTDPSQLEPVRCGLALLLSLKTTHPALFRAHTDSVAQETRHLERLFGTTLLTRILSAARTPTAEDYFKLSSELQMGEEWFARVRASLPGVGPLLTEYPL